MALVTAGRAGVMTPGEQVVGHAPVDLRRRQRHACPLIHRGRPGMYGYDRSEISVWVRVLCVRERDGSWRVTGGRRGVRAVFGGCGKGGRGCLDVGDGAAAAAVLQLCGAGSVRGAVKLTDPTGVAGEGGGSRVKMCPQVHAGTYFQTRLPSAVQHAGVIERGRAGPRGSHGCVQCGLQGGVAVCGWENVPARDRRCGCVFCR